MADQLLQIEIEQDLKSALAGIKPEAMIAAVGRGMKVGGQLIVGQVSKDRLTGQGPFPVSEHRLGVVTGRLRQAFRVEGPTTQGNEVTMLFGDPVEYAAIHEWGFVGQVTVKAHQREAKKGPISVREHQRKMNVPARAPITTGVAENLQMFGEAIADEVAEMMKGAGS